jgi:hypothetical protein
MMQTPGGAVSVALREAGLHPLARRVAGRELVAYLVERIERTPNITYLLHTVEDASGSGRLESLIIRDLRADEACAEQRHPACPK